jgi:hypothetical protein
MGQRLIRSAIIKGDIEIICIIIISILETTDTVETS